MPATYPVQTATVDGAVIDETKIPSYTAAQAGVATGGGGTGAVTGSTGLEGTEAVTGSTATDGAGGTGSGSAAITGGLWAYRDRYDAPEAADVVKGQILPSAANASPSAQPDFPTNLRVVFPIGWDGGDIQVSGILGDGAGTTETFVSPGAGGGTVDGFVAFCQINPGGIVNTVPTGVGVLTADIKTGLKLGTHRRPFSSIYKYNEDDVDATSTITGFASDGTFLPATPKNGVHNYEVWYYASHNHIDSGHVHTTPAHQHAAGTLAGPSHQHAAGTLAGPSHDHSQT